MAFYEKFEKICVENGVAPSKVIKELGFSSSSVTTWKKSNPSRTSIRKIATYFNVPTDYFESDTKKEVAPVGTTSRDEQSDYIMRALSSMPKDMLDNIEEICRLYNNDPGTDNQKLVNAIRSLLDLNK